VVTGSTLNKRSATDQVTVNDVASDRWIYARASNAAATIDIA
jgi:hypothetical protein